MKAPRSAPALGDGPSGTFLAGGICAALVRAARTGQGGVVDVSLLGSAVWTLGPDLAYTSLTGDQLSTDTIRSPLTQTYRTGDGYFCMLMMINEARYWDTATEALGLAELGRAYPDPAARQAAWADLPVPFAAAIAGLTKDEIAARLGERGCIFSFYATPQQVPAGPGRPGHRGERLPDGPPDPRRPEASGPPVQFDNQRPGLRRPAPGIGEHSAEVLAEGRPGLRHGLQRRVRPARRPRRRSGGEDARQRRLS